MILKRILALLLALSVLFAVVACGAKETPDDTEEQPGDDNTQEQQNQNTETAPVLTFSVMSYNTQNAGESRGNEPTHEAKYQKLAAMLSLKNPDIIALQECARDDVANEIRKKMTKKDDYRVITGSSGSHTALLYNQNAFKKVSSGCQQIGTKGDETGTAYDRYMLWAKLRSLETGTEFVVVSVHVDYVTEACLAQLQKIVDYLKENHAGTSAILMGDFNATQSVINRSAVVSERYLNVSASATSAKNKVQDTFPSGGTVIDYIYFKSAVSFKGLKAQYYEVVMQDDQNPSDHRPIYGEFSFGK